MKSWNFNMMQTAFNHHLVIKFNYIFKAKKFSMDCCINLVELSALGDVVDHLLICFFFEVLS